MLKMKKMSDLDREWIGRGVNGGERGIRTPMPFRTPVFKTGAIAVLPALRIRQIKLMNISTPTG